MIFEYRRRIFGYECDIYGHLNNAAYQHIYEEARAAALDQMELSLKELAEQGIKIFLRRIEIDYIRGIPFGAEVVIKSEVIRFSRVKSLWRQEAYDLRGELLSRAMVSGVFVKGGKPHRIDKRMEEIFAKFVS